MPEHAEYERARPMAHALADTMQRWDDEGMERWERVRHLFWQHAVRSYCCCCQRHECRGCCGDVACRDRCQGGCTPGWWTEH